MNTTPRHNPYTLIHKGLRACMTDVLVTVGRIDPLDADDVATAARAVREMLDFARSHLQHEEDWIHTALEDRRAGSSAATHADHLEHRAAFALLEASLRELEDSIGAERPVAALRLYRQLALFVADNFQHMHVEETENQATLIECYSEEEVLAIEAGIVGSLTPAEVALAMRWMLPSASAPERAGVLAAMQRTAPRPAFEGILAGIRPHLSARDREKLQAALEPTPTASNGAVVRTPAVFQVTASSAA